MQWISAEQPGAGYLNASRSQAIRYSDQEPLSISMHVSVFSCMIYACTLVDVLQYCFAGRLQAQ